MWRPSSTDVSALARAIYDLAISQGSLDMPEQLWKSYIDFEIEQREFAWLPKPFSRRELGECLAEILQE